MIRYLRKAMLVILLILTIYPVAGMAYSSTKYQWEDYTNRNPSNKPELSTNGVQIWYDNWVNMCASNVNGAVKIEYQPLAYDSSDYETEDEYYAAAANWMGNFGEAVNMWALEGISTCKYMTIRIKGEEGGEENKLIMYWYPNDRKFYSARFSDLVTSSGGHPHITNFWQDIVIDLNASGFPGMTNTLHLYAFARNTIYLKEIYFSRPIKAIDTTSPDTELAALTKNETGQPWDLPIKQYVMDLSNVVPEKTEATIDGVTYKLNQEGNTAVMVALSDDTITKLKVPDKISVDGNYFVVTEISAKAASNVSNLVTVTIGKNVTTIGKNAFNGCTKLKTVTLGSNLTTIGQAAFKGCKSLTKVTIPVKVTTIGKQAFMNCSKLKTITIKTPSLTSNAVGASAFKGIYKKATIKVPKAVLKEYQSLLPKKGVPKTAKIKK